MSRHLKSAKYFAGLLYSGNCTRERQCMILSAKTFWADVSFGGIAGRLRAVCGQHWTSALSRTYASGRHIKSCGLSIKRYWWNWSVV